MAKSKILIADDDNLVREAVRQILVMFGYEVTSFDNGQSVVDAVDDSFDVIILDINMPGMDGFETLQALNARELEIPVLFLTGAGSMDYAIKALGLGAYDFITKPIDDLDLFEATVKRAVEKRRYVLMERAYTNNLEVKVQEKTKELAEKNRLLEEYSHNLEIATVNIIMSLQTALEEKDIYTAGHTNRVTEYAIMIAQDLGLPKDEMSVLERAAQLHDIGKLVIDNSSIGKAGPLSPEEWELVRKHPEIGMTIISRLGFLGREGESIKNHHERMDGKGYPSRCNGSEIDLLTKILTVADSFDAMTSKRCYKENRSKREAIREMRSCAGTQFDEEVVNVFVSILETMEEHPE